MERDINYEPRIADHSDDPGMDSSFSDFIVSMRLEVRSIRQTCDGDLEIRIYERMCGRLEPVVEGLERKTEHLMSLTPPLQRSVDLQSQRVTVYEKLQYIEDYARRMADQVASDHLRRELLAFSRLANTEKRTAALHLGRSLDGYWG